jgi:hypothetical protein
MATLKDVSGFFEQPNTNNGDTLPGGERFFIDQLSINIESLGAEMHGGSDTIADDVSGHSWSTINVPLSWARNTFLYHVDSEEVNDNNLQDIQFKMLAYTTETNNIIGDELKFRNHKNIIPGESLVYYNAIPFYGNKSVASNSNEMKINADFVRHVAKELFGFAVTDLFVNEIAVRNSINSTSHTALHDKITALVSASAGVNPTTDLATMVFWNNTGNSVSDKFPTKMIMKQMFDNVRSRFNNIKGDNDELVHLFDTNGNTIILGDTTIFDVSGIRLPSAQQNDQFLWYKLPFMIGDMIFFKLHIDPPSDQGDLTGKTIIDARSYRVRLVIVADDDASITTGNNAWTDEGWDGVTPKYTNITGEETT